MLSPKSMLGLAALAGLPFASSAPQSTSDHAPRPTARPLRADVDLDGVDELLWLHPSGRLALYRDLPGDGPGELVPLDVPALDTLPALAGVALGDHDGDGVVDLLVATRSGGARLLLGDGLAGFLDVTEAVGLAHVEGVVEAGWQDLDRDGTPEVVLATARGFEVGRMVDGLLGLELLPVHAAVLAGSAASAPDGENDASDAASPAAAAAASDRTGDGSSGPRSIGSTEGSAGSAGESAALAADPGSGVATDGGSQLPFSLGCATGLDDPAGPACIQASETPLLGRLYPLTENLNVNILGRVGVGTTTPGAKLHVTHAGPALRAHTSADAVAAQVSTDSFDTPALVVDTPSSAGLGGHVNGVLEVGFRDTEFPFANQSRVRLSSFGQTGRLAAYNTSATATAVLEAQEVAGNGAQLGLRMFDGVETISLDAEYGTDGTQGARVSLFSRGGNETVEISSQEAVGNGAQIALSKADGTATIVLDAETARGCEVSLRNSLGTETIEMVTEEVAGNGAQILLRKADGSVGITLDAEQGGDGRVITEVLEITGGSDLVEGFDTGGVECPPGSVVVIDPERAGELTLSDVPYDFRVAGVVSGAGGVKPGLAMGQAGVLDGDTQVALTGRVYVRCCTEGGPIRPGHLLTTSSTRGVAMRAADAARANGAVLGKAMGSLDSGTGLVLVLVNLQ